MRRISFPNTVFKYYNRIHVIWISHSFTNQLALPELCIPLTYLSQNNVDLFTYLYNCSWNCSGLNIWLKYECGIQWKTTIWRVSRHEDLCCRKLYNKNYDLSRLCVRNKNNSQTHIFDKLYLHLETKDYCYHIKYKGVYNL